MERKFLYIGSAGWTRIGEMCITALLSAGIAFLQSILAQHTAGDIPPASPESAGIIGALIHGYRKFS